ncbi:MAG TPA: hypothetical protein VK165_20255 [Azonexus sp.]|nr:hypothetical protein [Azonexus sp.]
MTTTAKQCWSADGELFLFNSLRDLLDCKPELQAGDVVHVGEASYPETHQLIDADDVLCQMSDRAWDIAGEFAEDYPNVSKEAEAELDQLLKAWVEKHCPPEFFQVNNAKKYTLTAADLEAA